MTNLIDYILNLQLIDNRLIVDYEFKNIPSQTPSSLRCSDALKHAFFLNLV